MKQSGFTLLEVMVAMLVLAIGLLGLAGLMTSSMRNNLSASHRTQATWMAYDIIDRMRANRAGAVSGGYATVMGTAATCSPAVPAGTIKEQDIAAWKNQLACALPAGNGSITFPASGGARVVIRWDDSRGIADSTSQTVKTFTVETAL